LAARIGLPQHRWRHYWRAAFAARGGLKLRCKARPKTFHWQRVGSDAINNSTVLKANWNSVQVSSTLAFLNVEIDHPRCNSNALGRQLGTRTECYRLPGTLLLCHVAQSRMRSES
jgi:hypothetical protein